MCHRRFGATQAKQHVGHDCLCCCCPLLDHVRRSRLMEAAATRLLIAVISGSISILLAALGASGEVPPVQAPACAQWRGTQTSPLEKSKPLHAGFRSQEPMVAGAASGGATPQVGGPRCVH